MSGNSRRTFFIVSEVSGKILNVNPAWSATLGWSADDLIGKSGEWLSPTPMTVNVRLQNSPI